MKLNAALTLAMIAPCAVCLATVTITPMQPQAATQPTQPIPPSIDTQMATALQAVTNAQNDCDKLKQQLLEPVHNSAEYKHALTSMNSAQADLANARTQVPFSQDLVAALASKILADENLITKIEQPALDASPAWKSANATLLDANKSLQTAIQSRAQQQQETADRTRQQLESQRQQQWAAQQAQQQAAAAQAWKQQQQQPPPAQARNTPFANQFQSNLQNINAIRNQIQQGQQIMMLSIQIGQLQQQSANLAIQLADLNKDYQDEIAKSPPAANPPDPQGLQAQIQNVTAQHTQVEAKLQPLLQQVRSVSPENADLFANQGQGILEELTQLHQQQQNPTLPVAKSAAGASLIHFSSKVSPQVQMFLQGNLDEAERMKDPVYAAQKAQEQADRDAEQARQQQQAADDQARQAQEDAERAAQQQ